MATAEPIASSYEGAIAFGLKRYFTGQPCERAGHIYFRNLKRHCIKCKNELEKIRVSHGPAKEKIEKYRDSNKEKFRADHRRRYRENPKYYKDNAVKWARSNPEKSAVACRKKSAVWRSKNPDKLRVQWRTKRARKAASQGSHTRDDVAKIFKLQRGKCAYCRMKVGKKYHVDHIVALANGGANDRRNIQIACGTCNLRKNAKDPIDYARSQGMLL